MILLTVGTQLPFDRLVEIIDRLAPTLPEPMFAQVGQGRYRPVNMEWKPFVGPVEFEQRVRQCSSLIAHAGIGTLVVAQRYRKPIILFPRLAALDEHRNDHQLATVRALEGRPGVRVAYDETDLARLIVEPASAVETANRLPERDRLLATIANSIGSGKLRKSRS